MRNRAQPEEIIKMLCLDPPGLRVTYAAKGLGVSKTTLSTIISGKAET